MKTQVEVVVWEFEIGGRFFRVKRESKSNDAGFSYHPWCSGCAIGRGFPTLESAKQYCLQYLRKELLERKQKCIDDLIRVEQLLQKHSHTDESATENFRGV